MSGRLEEGGMRPNCGPAGYIGRGKDNSNEAIYLLASPPLCLERWIAGQTDHPSLAEVTVSTVLASAPLLFWAA